MINLGSHGTLLMTLSQILGLSPQIGGIWSNCMYILCRSKISENMKKKIPSFSFLVVALKRKKI